MNPIAFDARAAGMAGAVDTVTFSADATNQVPAQYAELELPFMMKWEDQIIVALGVEYETIKDFLWLRAGYNWGAAPVTSEGINSLFPPTVEHHVPFGAGLADLFPGFGLDVALEYALPNEVTSDETNQMGNEPPMPGATPTPNNYRVGVEMHQLTAHVGVHYEF